MIIFIYGADGYRIKENVDAVTDAYRKKHQNGMSHYRFDFSGDAGFDDLANAVKSISFFDEAKLIIVKNLFSARTGFSDKVVKLMDEFKTAADKKTVLVFVENKEQKELEKADKNLFAFLSSKPNLVRNIQYLSGTKLHNWVIGEFKKYGHAVSINAADLLIGFVGNESWALANEIEKLVNYKKGGTVTEKDVDALVARKEDPSIFDLTDAIGNKNRAKAFEMTYRLLNSGYDEYYLLNMLAYHFENLLSVSDALSRSPASGSQEVAKTCGLHPFVAKKAVGQAGKFQKSDLLAKFNRLASLDIASKNGQVNLEDSLYNFALL